MSDSTDSKAAARAKERHTTFCVTPVHSTETGKEIGHAVDLSITGMMLITAIQYPLGMKVELGIPEIQGVAGIQLSCLIMWSRPTLTGGYFIVGLQFESPDRLALEKLIQVL